MVSVEYDDQTIIFINNYFRFFHNILLCEYNNNILINRQSILNISICNYFFCNFFYFKKKFDCHQNAS